MRNASTRKVSQVETPLAATNVDVAYRLALAADKEREPALGYRLYWLSATEFASFDVPLDRDAFTIVGRHDQCDVVLEDDPTIALRHLLVRASRLDDGAPRLSVLDLHTDIGFEVAGAPERSISATGPIVFRVGAYAIVALPGGEPMPAALPEPVCSRAQSGRPYREPGCPAAIALLPRALELGESQPDPTGPGWTLTVTGARGVAEVRLSPVDLEIGVLVGRAPKCTTSSATSSTTASRACTCSFAEGARTTSPRRKGRTRAAGASAAWSSTTRGPTSASGRAARSRSTGAADLQSIQRMPTRRGSASNGSRLRSTRCQPRSASGAWSGCQIRPRA